MSNSPAERQRKRDFVAEQRLIDQQRREALKILQNIKRSPQPTALVDDLKQSDESVMASEVTSPPPPGEFCGTRYMESRGHLAISRSLHTSVTPHRHARVDQ